jgi:hypothetical protein
VGPRRQLLRGEAFLFAAGLLRRGTLRRCHVGAYDDFFAGFRFAFATGFFATLDENLPVWGDLGSPREARCQIIWAKNTFEWGFGRYKFQHEPIFYCHVADQKDAWYGDKSQSTLWEEKKPAANP